MTSHISELLAKKRVIVCCGAGGVGKTTVSASLALAAAQAGQRVIVVTVDPSKRLAESLGISPDQDAPVELNREIWGITGAGSLSAWLLDPKRVADHVVKACSDDGPSAEKLIKNRIYSAASGMIAGMQEYAAIESLHGFVMDGRYDLVVLDTPPSRNALRFLDSPSRISTVLNPKVFELFVATGGGPLKRGAHRIINKVLDLALGKRDRLDLQEFLHSFHGILAHLNHNQGEVQNFFRGNEVSFLLVTSPAQEALNEAFYFERKTQEMGLELGGYVLNRSLAAAKNHPLPSEVEIPDSAPLALLSALSKLGIFAEREAALVRNHVDLAESLKRRIGEDKVVRVLPQLAGDASDSDALVQFSRILGDDPNAALERAKKLHAGGVALKGPGPNGLPSTESWYPPKR